jgi:hypothetical protein
MLEIWEKIKPVGPTHQRPRSDRALAFRQWPPPLLPSPPVPAAVLAIERHCHCSPSSCKPRICAAILASTSSTHFKPEPTAITSGRSTSLAAASSPMSSSSPVAVCAPPAPPPLRGGLHDHVTYVHTFIADNFLSELSSSSTSPPTSSSSLVLLGEPRSNQPHQLFP